MRETHVVAAAIIRDGRVLCARRGASATLSGLWEFPGGKIEHGEAPAEALSREIREELSCTVDVGERVVTTRHEYEFGVVVLTTYVCELSGGWPQPLEHSEVAWALPSELDTLDWAPADIPAAAMVAARMSG